MKRADIVLAVLLGLTTCQVLWGWLQADRRFTRLTLVVWLFLLGLLSAYYVLLRSENFSRPVIRIHRWFFSWITEKRVMCLGIVLSGAYAVWYVYRVWGVPLMGKDFGAFFYRYVLLDELFPSLIGYNPMLNGGYQTTELLTSGSVNLFLVTYPIAAFFSVEAGFKAQPLLIILLLPALIYLSGRLVRFSPTESFLAAAFALVMTPIGHMGFGQMFFHGTLPYLFSCEIAVMVFALSYRIFVLGTGVAWGIPLIILLGSLASLHAVFFLIMGPVALATVFFGRIPARQKVLYSLVIAFGLLVINGNWLYELLSYDRGRFISGHVGPSWLSLVEWLGKLERNFLGLQIPLVVASAIGVGRLLHGTEEAEKRCLGGLLLFAVLYYTLLSSLGYFMVAGLQPMRFVVPLSFFLSLAVGPSWPVIESLWTRMEKDRTPRALIVNAALVAVTIFVCIPYLVFFVGIPTASPTSVELVKWLKENVSNNGRIFFYVPDGGAHHTPLGGQLPYFQLVTQRSLMGVPAAALPKRSTLWIQEIGECLDNPKSAATCRELYNIGYAVTFLENSNGKDASLSEDGMSGSFRLIKSIDRIRIYKARRRSSYFLIGEGEVKQHLNRIAVKAEPSEFIVLKFFWVPGLRAEPPLMVEPYPLPNGKAYVKVHSDFQRSFDILYR